MYNIVENHQKIRELNKKLSPIFDEFEQLRIGMDVIRKPDRNKAINLTDEKNKKYKVFLLTFYSGDMFAKTRECVTFTYSMNLYVEFNPKELEEVCIYSFDKYSQEKKELEEDYFNFIQKKPTLKQDMTFEQKQFTTKIINLLNEIQTKYNIEKEELMYFMILSILKKNVSIFGMTPNNLEDGITNRLKDLVYMATNNIIEEIKPKKVETIKQTNKVETINKEKTINENQHTHTYNEDKDFFIELKEKLKFKKPIEEKIIQQNEDEKSIEIKEKELLFFMHMYNTTLLPNITFGSMMANEVQPEINFLYSLGTNRMRPIKYYSNNYELYNYKMFDKVSKKFYASLTQEELEFERNKLMELNEYFKVVLEYVENKNQVFEQHFRKVEQMSTNEEEKELWAAKLEPQSLDKLINVNIRNYLSKSQQYVNIFYNNIMKYFNLIEMRNEENNGKYTDTIFVFEYIPYNEQKEVIEQKTKIDTLLGQEEVRFKSPLKTNIEYWLKGLVARKHFSNISFDEKTKEWVIPLSKIEDDIIYWNKTVVEKIYNIQQHLKENSISYNASDLSNTLKEFLFELINDNIDTIIFDEKENKFYIQNEDIDEGDMEYNVLLINKINTLEKDFV